MKGHALSASTKTEKVGEAAQGTATWSRGRGKVQRELKAEQSLEKRKGQSGICVSLWHGGQDTE